MLFSYHYFDGADIGALLDAFDCPTLDVFADSGAYSAASLGKPIEPQQYIEWIARWGDRFTACAAPDVIGDAEATAAATETMLAQIKGRAVLPVFHFGEPWEFLEHWATRLPYIALGGMVPFIRQPKLLRAWLDESFARIPSGVKVHGFGMTTLPLILPFPWYSVDSSSWAASVRFGMLVLFNSRTGRVEKVDMRKRADLMRHREVLGQYGLTPSEVMNTRYKRERIVGATIASWSRLEAWLTAREANHGEEAETGT
jgi:hypothetical protein